MAKIKNVTLTPELTEHLIALLETAPEEILLKAGKGRLAGGFTNANAIRERLATMMRSSGTLEPWVTMMMRCGMAAQPVVSMLSPEGLRGGFDSLAALGGWENLMLAILCDPREEVQKFGAEMVARRTPPPAEKTTPSESEYQAARRSFTEWLDGNLLHFAGFNLNSQKVPADGTAAAPNPPGKEVDVDELIRVSTQLRKLADVRQKTITDLRRGIEEQARKQQSRLDAAAKRAAEEKKKIVAEREDARRLVLRLQKEKAALTARVEELNAAHQSRIDKSVEENTSVIVRKWLAEPRESEQLLEQINGSDLLARVEQALDAQARQDRLTGNRLELERQLTRLREARERLHGAATTALCPVPRLRELLAELDAEIARVQKALTGERPVDPLTEKLLMTINQARTWDETREVSKLIERLEDAELIRSEDRRRLFDALQRKCSILDETTRARHEEQVDHGWSLRNALYRNLPTLVLLDGHNILFGLEDIFQSHFAENGRPGRAARERLVELVGKLLEGRTNVHAHILFDAPHHEVVTISPRITIEFSGGRGEHRADRVIADHVAWRRPNELGQIRYVITDDRAVRRDATKHGAYPVPIDLFAVFLNDFNCLNANPLVAA